MRAAALALVVQLFAAGVATAQTRPSLDDALTEHVRAVQSRDPVALERTITSGERLELILPDGRRSTTRAEYLAFYREWFAEPGWTISIRPISRVERPNLAVVTARTRQEERDGRRLTGWTENWATLTFAREPGGWRLVQDQNTRIRSGPTRRGD